MTLLEKFLSKIAIIKALKPSYKTGGDGSRGTCDCIGLIIGAFRRAGIKWSGIHGSNWFARKEITKLEKVNNASELKVGDAVFQTYEPNEKGIQDVVRQQFTIAKTICENGLVPIIEPEVDINIPDKKEAEDILKEEIINVLNTWNKEDLIMFKFTIPTVPNLYLDLYNYECVIRIVALSGGYETNKACELLKQNKNMIASFSRALLQDLFEYQTDDEFNKELENAIDKIYEASI